MSNPFAKKPCLTLAEVQLLNETLELPDSTRNLLCDAVLCPWTVDWKQYQRALRLTLIRLRHRGPNRHAAH